jgi:catechol 1,2-dioxygenase
VIDYVVNDDAASAKEWDLPSPFFEVQRDFVLSQTRA